MEKIIKINNYDPNKGLELKWKDGFIIKVLFEDGEVRLSANNDGLESLANHFLNLAQKEVPVGSHIHLDEYNSLEEGSFDFCIEKI